MDEIFYVTPNGYKISQSEALERYGDEGFDQLVNEGQLTEFVEEETPELNFQDGGHFYETPNGKVYSEGDLVNRYGVEEFKSYVQSGSLKKKILRISFQVFRVAHQMLQLHRLPFLKRLITFKEPLAIY